MYQKKKAFFFCLCSNFRAAISAVLVTRAPVGTAKISRSPAPEFNCYTYKKIHNVSQNNWEKNVAAPRTYVRTYLQVKTVDGKIKMRDETGRASTRANPHIALLYAVEVDKVVVGSDGQGLPVGRKLHLVQHFHAVFV